MEADWLEQYRFEEYLPNVLTPPYVSNVPEIHFHRRSNEDPSSEFLILCSDGFLDLYGGNFEERIVNDWVNIVAQELERRRTDAQDPENLAVCLLRDGLGGDDTKLVSRNLTVEMDEKWMDDTTILVVRFI